MKTLSLKLPDALNAQLASTARREQKTKSNVVRDALEAYFNGGERAKHATIGELAADLIGSGEGPGDLSYNSKYMDDFGK